MLDDLRREAVLEVLASLPLSERQCALADETLEDMALEDTNQIISLT
ncbi:hypothetical protein [Azospirillum thiophilum]|nr:hypothetical protein [Azospirillum thiophilum]